MNVTCLIDNTEHESLEALHKYLRPRMKQETYYLQYIAKVDPATKEPIPFKNVDQYLAQDFIDKQSLRKWLGVEPTKGRAWALDWLKKRKEEKQLIYAPSQVELRSLECPSMPYYDSVGGYYNIMRELWFVDRYIDEKPVSKHRILGVIQDTREQLPIKLGIKTTVSKVPYGDYSMTPDQGIYIERKSLGDFVGTLNRRINERVRKDDTVTLDSSFDRFDRELARAATNGHYIVMLVEASLKDTLDFRSIEEMRWSRVAPSHVFKNLRDLLIKYPLNFQAVFADGRVETARIARKIFEMGAQVKHIDLQNALEKGLL